MRARIEAGIVYSPYTYSPLAYDGALYGSLMERLTAHGSTTALVCGHDKLTYWELRDKLQHCAAGFHRRGIGKGDRVFVHIDNSIESFVAVCSVPLTGATLVSSDIMWREGERTRVPSNLYMVLTQKVFVVGEKRYGFNSVFEFVGNDESLNENEKFDYGDCTFVEWTTGTTGASKGVEYREERFLRQISCVVGAEMFACNDVFLGDCNISCLMVFFLWLLALHLGSTIVISRTCDAVPLDLFDVIKDCKAVTIVSFPSRLKRMLNFMKTSEDWDIALRKSLRRIIIVGSVTPPALAEELASTFQLDELRSCYGMSEAGGFMAVPPKGEVSGTNAGFPIPGARMKIIDTVSSKVLGPMQCGEVLFDTPLAVTGYCGHLEDATDFMDTEGWIHTDRMASFMHLHGGVYFAEALPRNTRGKVRATSLRELLGTLRRMDSTDESTAGDCIY
ncbi:hypothetical protein HPB52_020905 [Rhipicephalus sanguineus]|uniref:AMP-dependent synthetase/ligase domain-containing protein n=1 Tax=Rhipicephalus sanguineus TaxID=34632 RepID=A0A9D4Q3H1_RHISA|nr:hypothetical protein HPB52_020905 [Rhipicephalus sanguineus]